MAYELHSYTGGWIMLDTEESHVTAAMARGEYEPRKIETMARYLRPGLTFVDVGANFGYFTLLAARLVGEFGQVIAIEPHPENMERLRSSVLACGYENVLTVQAAVGQPGVRAVPLYLGEQSGQHTLLPGVRPSGDSVEVIQMSLHEILADLGIDQVDMLKIDVEGAEEMVLAHTDWYGITSYRGLILMLDLHPELGIDPRSICQRLRRYGFDAPEHPDPNLHELIVRRSS